MSKRAAPAAPLVPVIQSLHVALDIAAKTPAPLAPVAVRPSNGGSVPVSTIGKETLINAVQQGALPDKQGFLFDSLDK